MTKLFNILAPGKHYETTLVHPTNEFQWFQEYDGGHHRLGDSQFEKQNKPSLIDRFELCVATHYFNFFLCLHVFKSISNLI